MNKLVYNKLNIYKPCPFLLFISAILMYCFILFVSPTIYADNNEDTRTLVLLPDDIKDKTIAFMQSHLHALEDVIHAIQNDNYAEAELIVETRLKFSSPSMYDQHPIIKHWPKSMQNMADQLYQSANHYVAVSKDASTPESSKTDEDVIAALGKVVIACRSCHKSFRFR